jgi:TRAP-type uncharacterized transport system substrate-binding protein
MEASDMSQEPIHRPSMGSARHKMTLLVVAGALLILGLGASAYYFAMRPVTLRIAVGPQNSDDVKVIQALTQNFSRERARIRLRPVPTDGAVASAAAIGEGKADLAIVRADLDIPKNALAVAALRKNVAVLWVPTPAKTTAKAAAGTKRAKKDPKGPEEITKISQLAGKKIGVIGRTPANIALLKVILAQYAVDAAKVEFVQFATNEVAEAVRSQRADVFMAAGPINSKITAEAIAATSRDGGPPTFLSIDLADAIAQNFPKYEAADIPAGAFGGSPDRPEEEVKTISFPHLFVARQGLSDSVVSAFTRQLFAARLALMAEFPLSAKIETPDTDKDAVIAVHPGAAAFVDGEEKSFLDRYSDFIWFTLIGLSGMGSAGAWLASYLRRDERNNNSNLRERLLDMLSVARRSDSWQELDAMQKEADAILRDTLTCYENGAIEQGSLNAFNIALEQFHNAVADRKAVLSLELPGQIPIQGGPVEVLPKDPATNPNWPPRPQVA